MSDSAAETTVFEHVGNDGLYAVSGSDGYPEEYRLLELTPEIAAQLDAGDTTLVVRGRDTDAAVLIDANEQAHAMHTAHTSNSMYLLTQDSRQLVLRTKLHQVFDLQPTRPQIRARVLEVLQWDTRGAFRGTEFEHDGSVTNDESVTDGVRVTDTVLGQHVQAGRTHVRRVLDDVLAFRHNVSGHWRVLDAGYASDVLRVILATHVERDWPLDALHVDTVYSALHAESHILREVVDAVLRRFATEQMGVFAMDTRRVCVFLAEQIFASAGSRAWPVPEFLRALRATMPPQLSLHEDMSEWGSRSISTSVVGKLAVATCAPADEHLLHSPNGVPASLTLLLPLDNNTLPQDVRARMRGLFAAKSKWTAREMRPFLEDLVADDNPSVVAKAVDSWLLKFGRGVRGSNGESVYTSRIN
ncbi:Ctf8p and Ctf18p associating protein [Coemansia sp. RSA 1199]|nr:Ctf8p and Ctf18p associating protein [Coemansia sp. RSA 1199]